MQERHKQVNFKKRKPICSLTNDITSSLTLEKRDRVTASTVTFLSFIFCQAVKISNHKGGNEFQKTKKEKYIHSTKGGVKSRTEE